MPHSRPLRQYGEYATPKEVAALRGAATEVSMMRFGRSSADRNSLTRAYWKSRDRCPTPTVSGSNRSARMLVTPSGERSSIPRTTRAGESRTTRR